MTKYPAQIDNNQTLPPVVDNVTPIKANIFNDLRDAIIATESELGVKPSGIYSTVRARLDVLEKNGGVGPPGPPGLQGPEGPIGPEGPAGPGSNAIATPTYASLRLITSPSISNLYMTQCRTTKNDNAGGLFVYDPTDTTSTDNDGTILVAGTARYKRIFSGPINIRWFGAKGDGITDDLPAFNAAIAALPAGGGAIYMPEGTYFISDTIVLTKIIRLIGALSPAPTPACKIKVATGRTAIHMAANIPSTCENFGIYAASKLATSSVITSYTPGTNSITVSSGHDFTVGQVVRGSLGGPYKRLDPLIATTTIGNASFTLGNIDLNARGMIVGQYLKISTAWPTPTQIVSIVDFGATSTITMSTPAAASLTLAPIDLVNDAVFMITAVNGNILTVDNNNPTGIVPVGVSLKHCDCGIYMQGSGVVRDMSFGSFSLGFSGYGIAVVASHNFTPASNANLFMIEAIWCDASYGCVFAQGADANAGTIIGARAVNSSGMTFQDLSDLGNSYYSCHASGGLGFLSNDGGINRSEFSGCYAEGGTSAFLGSTTRVDGGTMPHIGNAGFLQDFNLMNRLYVGGFDAWNNGRTYMDPVRALFGIELDATSQLFTSRSTISNQIFSTLGWLAWNQTNTSIGINGTSTYSCPMAINLKDTSGSGSDKRRPGSLFFPTGFELGSRENDIPDKPRHRTATIAEAAAETPASDVFARRGDVIWHKTPSAGGMIGWVCITAGNGIATPGIFKAFGLIDSGSSIINISTATATVGAGTYTNSSIMIRPPSAPVTITLDEANLNVSLGTLTGFKLTFKDAAGTAGSYPITINFSVTGADGNTSLVINGNYDSYTIVYNGTEWSIV